MRGLDAHGCPFLQVLIRALLKIRAKLDSIVVASPTCRRSIETQAAMKARAQEGINAPPTDDADWTTGATPALAATGPDNTIPGELTIGSPTAIVWRSQDAIAAPPEQGAIVSPEAIGALPAEGVIDAMHARAASDVTTTCLAVAAPSTL